MGIESKIFILLTEWLAKKAGNSLSFFVVFLLIKIVSNHLKEKSQNLMGLDKWN